MKKAVMNKAWSIRKAAACEMRCKVSEVCFSICLKMAWQEIKSVRSVRYVWNGYAGARSWAARITGRCSTYVFARDFRGVQKFGHSQNGKRFKCRIEIREGEVFQISNGYKREFLTVIDGEIDWLTETEVKAMF